jgi:hypothetical protein
MPLKKSASDSKKMLENSAIVLEGGNRFPSFFVGVDMSLVVMQNEVESLGFIFRQQNETWNAFFVNEPLWQKGKPTLEAAVREAHAELLQFDKVF